MTALPGPEFRASDVVRALESVWNLDIGALHPGLPQAVIVMASGSEGMRLKRYGHWAESRWKAIRGGGALAEVLLAAERLAHGPKFVLETLLHEAAHGLATSRKIQDTSRQGRYHNKAYRDLAREVGLEVEKDAQYGWTETSLPPDLEHVYSRALAELKKVCTAYRTIPIDDDNPTKARPRYECACGTPRVLRMSRKMAAEGPVLCGLCEVEFALVDETPGGEE